MASAMKPSERRSPTSRTARPLWICWLRAAGSPRQFPETVLARYSGTSLATPHVSGAWAVLKSKAPNATVPQLLSMMSRTGIPITDARNGLVTPRIQVDAALDVVIPELSYSTGTHLTLTARPEPGFRFTLWRGCDSSSGNRCVVEMGSIKNVSAIFEPLGAAPDLLTTSLAAPPAASAGSEVSIDARVHNQGSVDAGPFRLGILSCPPTLTLLPTTFGLPPAPTTPGCRREDLKPAARIFRFPSVSVPGRIFWGSLRMTWIGLLRKVRPTTLEQPIQDRLKFWLPGSARGHSYR